MKVSKWDTIDKPWKGLNSILKKSHTNKIKHGIDFLEAQALWTDSDGIEVPALTRDEPRFGRIACYGGKLWTAFYTHRADRIRLFSVRRARLKEEEVYAQKNT